jgi:Asp-tRNA(Asn)/Glu-tRNA(Gln) amidotransferase B subunit
LPADILGIDDDLAAYWFNEVVEVFGQQVDALLSIREKKGSGKHITYDNKYTLKKAIRAVLKEYRRSRNEQQSGGFITQQLQQMKEANLTRFTGKAY